MGLNTKSIGILLIIMIPLMIGGIWWWTGPRIERREKLREVATTDLGKQITLAAQMFTQDHNNRLPNSAHWEEDLVPYYPGILKANVIMGPDGDISRRFAMNAALSGVSIDTLQSPADTVIFFESTSKAHDAADRFVSTPSDVWSRVVMFADGHGYSFPLQAIAAMRQRLTDKRFLDGK